MIAPRTARSRRAVRNAARRLSAALIVLIFWIHAHASVTLVDASGACAPIESPSNLTDAEAQAVSDFSNALKSVGRGGGPSDAVGRVVLERAGETPRSPDDVESFSVTAAGNVLRLRAQTPGGLVQGIYWFLRTHGGVRWYVPGDPAIVPQKRPWILDDFAQTPIPSFESRILYGLAGHEGALWGQRNGLGNPIAFSHNLANVVTPALLQQNPDWRCVFSGVRIPPPHARFYQPELQRAAMAQSSAQTAADFFKKNPSSFSFSLGLNDNTRFSQSDDALRARGPLRFYRDLPDYSDTVFTFMNRAGAALAENGYGDRCLGCLAYQWNLNAPSFSVNPNIVPFVASDRTFWHAEDFRSDETALLKRWADSGVRRFGLYDYLYGSPFLIPRPLECLPQWLRAGHDAGADAYFAEALPVGEYDTQKLWIAAALLWDIKANPDDLAREWMRARYGEAAEPVRAFFKRWEDAWASQTKNTYWLRNYWDEAQGLLVTSRDLDAMQACLAQAAGRVQDDAPRAAAVAALRARFALTDAFCRLLNAKAAVADAPALRAAQDAERLYDQLTALLQARAHWLALLKTAPATIRSAAVHTERSDPSVGALVALAQRARAQGRMKAYLNSIQGIQLHPGATAAFADAYGALARQTVLAPAANRLANADFRATRTATLTDFNPLWPQYAGTLPAQWPMRALRSEALSVKLENMEGRRARAFSIKAAENVHLFQWAALPAGETVFFSAELRGRIEEGAQVLLVLTWNDETGAQRTREARLFPGDYRDGRTLWMTTPPFAKPTRCAIGLIVAHQGKHGPLLIALPAAKRFPDKPVPDGAAHR